MSALTGPVQPPQTQIIPVVEAPRTVRRDLLRGRTESWWDRMVLAGVGVLATVLGLWNLTGATAYQDDEGTYTAQAFSVLEGQLAPYTYWYDHPPLGWIQLGSLAWLPELLGLGDGTYIGATRFAIVPFFVATAMLVYLIGRRLGVSRPIAGLTVLVFVLSPLTLVIGRQVYIDNIGIPWLLLAFYLALSPRGALWHHVGAGVFFAVAVLSKETLAIFGPALLVALLNRPNWSNRVFSTVGFLVVGGLVLFSYPLMALLRGELFAGPNHVSLQEALAFQFMDRSGSGSIWEAGSSRAELLEGWLYYDTYLVLAGVAAGVLCLMRRRAVWIPVAMATFAVPVLTGEGYLPSMYIIGVVPFLALALGVAADILWSAFRKVVAPLAPRPRTVATIVVDGPALVGTEQSPAHRGGEHRLGVHPGMGAGERAPTGHDPGPLLDVAGRQHQRVGRPLGRGGHGESGSRQPVPAGAPRGRGSTGLDHRGPVHTGQHRQPRPGHGRRSAGGIRARADLRRLERPRGDQPVRPIDLFFPPVVAGTPRLTRDAAP